MDVSSRYFFFILPGVNRLLKGLNAYNWHNYPLGRAGDPDIDKNVMNATFNLGMRESARQIMAANFSDNREVWERHHIICFLPPKSISEKIVLPCPDWRVRRCFQQRSERFHKHIHVRFLVLGLDGSDDGRRTQSTTINN